MPSLQSSPAPAPLGGQIEAGDSTGSSGSSCPLLSDSSPQSALTLTYHSKSGEISELSSSILNPAPEPGLAGPARELRMGGQWMRVKGAFPSPLPFPPSSPPAPTAGPAVLQLPEAPTLEVALLWLGPQRGAGCGWCLPPPPPVQGPLRDPAKWSHPARLGREYPPPWSRVGIFTGGSNLQSPLGGRWGASPLSPAY